MAKKSKIDSEVTGKRSWEISKQYKIVIGSLLVLFSIALLVAFVSFYIHGQADQSAVAKLSDRNAVVNNWLGKFGAYLADILVYQGFGVASFLFVRLFFLTGIYLFLGIPLGKLRNTWFWDLFAMIVVSIIFGFFATSAPELGGIIGYEMNLFSQDYIGKTGTLLLLIFGLVVYLIFKIKVSPESIHNFIENSKKEIESKITASPEKSSDSSYNLEEYAVPSPEEEKDEEVDGIHLKSTTSQFEINKEALKPTISSSSEINLDTLPKPIVEPIVTHVLQ
jgi:S-DNA-T family DNA segregation ATPase FtsK/SpoIIIE